MTKFTFPLILAAFGTIALTACDDRNPGAQAPAESEAITKSEKIRFTATITGEVNEALEGNGWLFCSATNGADPKPEPTFSFRVPNPATRQEFELEFPLALGSGTHPLYGANTMKGLQADTARVLYVTANGDKYSSDGTTGELIILTLPQKEGDLLTGTVKAAITAKDYSGKTVNVEAKFDLLLRPRSMDECK